MKQNPKIALIGNPNSGKSSLFNQLTGLRQKTGNFPGVTVDKLSGYWKIDRSIEAEVIDLPGIYSVYPKSADEQVVIDILANPEHLDFPDLAIIVADASNLKRNLLLFSQIADFGVPVVLALNMLDVAHNQGIDIDSLKLSKQLGIPVAEVHAKNGIGINGLRLAVSKALADKPHPIPFLKSNGYAQLFGTVANRFNLSNDYLAALYVSQGNDFSFLRKEEKEQLATLAEKADFNTIKFQSKDTIQRYELISPIVDSVTIHVQFF